MAENMHRVQVDLTREDIEFLHRISLDSKFSNGKTLPRTVCIRALLSAIRDLDLPPESFQDGKSLLKAVKEHACK